MDIAEDIQFHPWNTTYIFTAVKIQLFIFSQLWNTAFYKYALYLINIFLYFITLYIINISTTLFTVIQLCILCLAVNSMHIILNKICIFLNIFHRSKTRLSWQLWDWDIFQKVLSEIYLSEIILRMFWHQHQTWHHCLAWCSASLHVTPILRYT